MRPASALTCLLLLLAFTPCLAGDGQGKDREVDESKIYYGDPNSFETPAVLSICKVFDAIPEYRDAKSKGKDDSEYYILLEKANQKFYAALAKAVADGRYDLVGEVGSIKAKGKEIPDITAAVIKALPK